jgi:hypothetical protein
MSEGHTKTLYTRHSMDELRELTEKLEKRGSVVADWVLSARAMLARIVKKKGGLKRASLQVADDDVYAKVWNIRCCSWRMACLRRAGGLADNRPSPPRSESKPRTGSVTRPCPGLLARTTLPGRWPPMARTIPISRTPRH